MLWLRREPPFSLSDGVAFALADTHPDAHRTLLAFSFAHSGVRCLIAVL